MTKVCSKCREEKIVEEFYKCKRTKDGLDRWCKKCKKSHSFPREYIVIEFKICSKCKLKKNINEFCKYKKSTDGHKGTCKACESQYRENNKEKIKQYRIDHKEELRRYGKQYNKGHKAEHRNYNKQYYKDNREYAIQYQKQYEIDHRGERKQYREQYYKKHKDKFDQYSHQRSRKIVGNLSNSYILQQLHITKSDVDFVNQELKTYDKDLDWLIDLKRRAILDYRGRKNDMSKGKCPRCHEEKPLIEFFERGICKTCRRLVIKKYNKDNKEKIKEHKRLYREINKEKIKKYKRRYYETNREKINEYRRLYRAKRKLERSTEQ